MTRVMVIGNAGGGKSTMCAAICAVHGLPYAAIDRIQWQPGWVPTPPEEYAEQHSDLIAQDRWLIDGYGSWESVLARIDAADTIILVDHPILVHFWWATKRQVRSIFRGRPDGPEGCRMWPVTVRLYRMMWWLHRTMRPRLLAEINLHNRSKRIIRIRSPRELNAFARNPV
ncbi:MAG: ATPase AAA [Minwuia thermotolerans]|nr:MAG: ATPase AAA [Minwuia thermotolerans]